MRWAGSAAAVAAAAVLLSRWLGGPRELAPSLSGRFAVVTGGGRGAGRGFVHGLTSAGATVWASGRTEASVRQACSDAPGPGKCVPAVVDSANDTALEAFFARVATSTNGTLDILVNNAYGGVGYWRAHGLLGKPFWETGAGLYDAVHDVGVRSHFVATAIAVPMLRRASRAGAGRRGLVVNTNSGGCLVYAFNVAYGMGKCAIDKFTADAAIELATEGVDVVSWWAKEPLQTEEVLAGALEGATPRRGLPPLLGDALAATGMRWDELARTALAGTLLWEGRVLSALARDPDRPAFSGLAVRTSELAGRYGVLDERGLHSPSFFSVKWQVFALVPVLRDWTAIGCSSPGGGADGGECAPSASLRFVFNRLPDGNVPVWLVKLLAGVPPTVQWPGLVVR